MKCKLKNAHSLFCLYIKRPTLKRTRKHSITEHNMLLFPVSGSGFVQRVFQPALVMCWSADKCPHLGLRVVSLWDPEVHQPDELDHRRHAQLEGLGQPLSLKQIIIKCLLCYLVTFHNCVNWKGHITIVYHKKLTM